jgi:hypothetical protein
MRILSVTTVTLRHGVKELRYLEKVFLNAITVEAVLDPMFALVAMAILDLIAKQHYAGIDKEMAI